jgi:hypothetical protein
MIVVDFKEVFSQPEQKASVFDQYVTGNFPTARRPIYLIQTAMEEVKCP